MADTSDQIRDGGHFALHNPTVAISDPPGVETPPAQPPAPTWQQVGKPILVNVEPAPGT